jgi:hypothetical protein
MSAPQVTVAGGVRSQVHRFSRQLVHQRSEGEIFRHPRPLRFTGKAILVSPDRERHIALSIVHRFKRPEIAFERRIKTAMRRPIQAHLIATNGNPGSVTGWVTGLGDKLG